MVLDLIVKKRDDGFTAEIPSIKGCESWAHDEESVIENVIELASFYLDIEKNQFKIDKARKGVKHDVYKLIFTKS
jgi:predicted RNase H-like HicB family nuclease